MGATKGGGCRVPRAPTRDNWQGTRGTDGDGDADGGADGGGARSLLMPLRLPYSLPSLGLCLARAWWADGTDGNCHHGVHATAGGAPTPWGLA